MLVLVEYITAREVCHRINGNRDGESASRLAMDESSVALAPVASSSQSPPQTPHQPDCPTSQKIVGLGPRWGLAHSYLVQMGALKFKLDKAEQFPTLVGIQQLAQCNMLPSVSFLDPKIKALQKSDKLAKTLVCLQVSWLVIQAIARRIENLPVTLLELNTIAQVWVALVIYGLWWFKPQGIVEVIVIDFGHCEGCRKQLHENGIPSPDSSFASTPPEYGHDSNIRLAVGILLILGVVYVAIDALGWTAYAQRNGRVAGVNLLFSCRHDVRSVGVALCTCHREKGMGRRHFRGRCDCVGRAWKAPADNRSVHKHPSSSCRSL